MNAGPCDHGPGKGSSSGLINADDNCIVLRRNRHIPQKLTSELSKKLLRDFSFIPGHLTLLRPHGGITAFAAEQDDVSREGLFEDEAECLPAVGNSMCRDAMVWHAQGDPNVRHPWPGK